MIDDRAPLPDETLEDGPLPLPPSADVRRELIDQRFVHGLLRAMHGADASGREARIRSVLDRMPTTAAPRPLVRLAVAAFLVLAVGTALLVLPANGGLPRADAMVKQALRELSRPVNHRYRIDLELRARDRDDVLRREFTLTVRAGDRFLLRGEGATGAFECGSDGETLWCKPSIALLRWSKPDHRSSSLGTLLSRTDVDQADLDLHGLIEALGDSARSMAVQRVPARRAGGGTLVRVEARDFDPSGARHKRLVRSLQVVALEVDQESGSLERVELIRRPVPNWDLHFVFGYEGTVELPEDAYARPW